MTDADPLLEEARAWAADDLDPATRATLEAEIEAAAAGDESACATLADRFAGPLEFGTAGLRGELGPGPRRMNRVVVVRAAAGLAAYLHARHDTSRGRLSVVIGYDARHYSETFAADTAAVMRGAGIEALVLPRPLPTPVLAFAIRELGCDAGVMVTASHNPPRDNGYKVYLGDGSQIVPPADAEIAAAIAEVTAAGPVADVARKDGARTLTEDVVDRYLDTAAGLAGDGPRDLSVVYTPLHGVGAGPAVQVLETAGFDAPYVVESQEQPDPDFPTVAFPNPEEPGAMDAALGWPPASAPTSWWPTTPTRTAAPRRCRATPGGGCCAATRSARCWPSTRCPPAGRAPSRRRSSRRGRSRGWPPRRDSRTSRRSPGSSGSAGSTAWPSATRRRSATAATPASVRDRDGVSALLLLCELAAATKAAGRSLLDRARRPGRRARPACHRPALGARRGPLADHRRDGAVARRPPRRPSAGWPSRPSTTSPPAPPTCRRPTACASPSPRAPASSCVRAAPSRSSRPTSRSSCRSRPTGSEERTDAVGAARIQAATRLDAVRGDLSLALGL